MRRRVRLARFHAKISLRRTACRAPFPAWCPSQGTTARCHRDRTPPAARERRATCQACLVKFRQRRRAAVVNIVVWLWAHPHQHDSENPDAPRHVSLGVLGVLRQLGHCMQRRQAPGRQRVLDLVGPRRGAASSIASSSIALALALGRLSHLLLLPHLLRVLVAGGLRQSC